MTEKPKVVFFGTGPVSYSTLEDIYQDIEIEAVVTKSSNVQSRKQDNKNVEEWAKGHKIPVLIADNKDDLSRVYKKNKFSSTVGLVVDFGIIIPDDVINAFKKGIINSHFSLLPEWRGADPITFAILSGQKQTGVSIMQIVNRLDEGDLLATQKYDIPPKITISDLTQDLVRLSSELLIGIIPKYLDGRIKPYPQPSDIKPSYSRKITKQDGVIDWKNKSAIQIEREVRAYLGWPKSKLHHKGLDIIILESSVSQEQADPGQLLIKENKLILGCKQSALEITQLQIAGKKPMDAKSFINGHRDILA